MKGKSENTVENNLRLLYDLQLIDSKIDEIKNLQGELPVEIEQLDVDLERTRAAIKAAEEKIEALSGEIKNQKTAIENAKAFIKKYTEQQKNVRNNREYNSISKEIEYQELEIQLIEKNIGKNQHRITQEETSLETLKANLEKQTELYDVKRKSLDSIMSETSKDETFLKEKSEEARNQIEEPLLKTYDKLRQNLKNGLAVVSIGRGASTGSFIAVPPQLQMEVASRKRIITDEYSRRILVDAELAQEETQKIESLLKK